MASIKEESSLQSARSDYALLTKTEQEILQFLSILMESTNRTNLAKFLRESGVLGDNGKPLTILALAPVVERMTKLKLVTVDRDAVNQFRCASRVAAYATQMAAIEGRLTKMAAIIQKEFPLFHKYYYSDSRKIYSFDRCLRELRIAIFSHDPQQFEILFKACRNQFMDSMTVECPFVTICDSPFDMEWFQDLPPFIQAEALDEIIQNRLKNFASVSDILLLLHNLKDHTDEVNGRKFRKQLITILLFQGRISDAKIILGSAESIEDASALHGWLKFLLGENETSIQIFELVIKSLKGTSEKRKFIFNGMSGIFFLLALLKSSNPAHRVRLGEYLELVQKKPRMHVMPLFDCFSATLLAQQNKVKNALSIIDPNPLDEEFNWTTIRLVDYSSADRNTSLTKLFLAVARFWIDKEHARKKNTGLKDLFNQAKHNGHQWAAMETATLLTALGQEVTTYEGYAETVQQETGIHSILPIIAQEEGWERALNALIQMGVTSNGKVEAKNGDNSRLIWMIALSGNSVTHIQPREQTRSTSGNWSKGRPIALKRLFQNTDSPACLTEQDRRICTAIARNSDYYGGPTYEFTWTNAMLAMVGHPLVFWEASPNINVEVVKAEPELLVEQKGNQVSIRFSGTVEQEGVIAIKETPTCCKLVEITKAHKQIGEILGGKSLRIPVKGKEQVMQAVQAIASMVTIHSSIGGGVANVEELPAEAKPHMLLWPHGDGLKVNLLVQPFSGDGPYFQPGKGGKTIIAEVNGKRAQTHRNFKDEIAQANLVVSACPSLATEDGQTEWFFDDPELCLELLMELQSVTDKVVVAWPEGEKMRVSRPVSMDGMRVTIQREQDWFSMTGELSLDEGLIMEMHRLLDLARGKESRFIPLGEGRFLALTEAFRKRLAEIDAFSEKSATGQRFHTLASPVLRDLLTEAGQVKADTHWKRHIKRLDQAQSIDPAPPSTLRAELRDYQVTGFRWLARLAAWGVGGCLADDMGLGKTVQALTLLLHRAQEGASLVVAPTSVGLNWLVEIERFAPTLNGIVFGGGQRQQILDTIKPFDVVICSYGLLQQEAEMLAKVRWNVIVLDEAQAIKNRLTKRSQAAMALTGLFRIATTGTPMENHLGELWNLFQFINPGLFGPLEVFNERFASPIERYGDKGAQKRLRKLIQPFLLRRLKSQVLEELPSRTEIVLHVEMSEEEMAFYETLRRKAIEQIENLDGPMEQKRFQILAEIMRLRRACCNSRLVLPDSPIESSKLALFWEVVEELLENRHKVLVFSQFVDHLSIIRALLDEKQVVYQYLDGSTPAKERQRRVEAFQSGEGDLFLISLRAGGMGINLTAADYVIHMDPWWNPAVEDQASDRAHRIGQLRPVTIYRLVTKETIEEKIVALHRHKRDLADGLLEGGDMSGKVSLEELLNMIRARE